jgi:hypothetical protein
MKEHIATPYPGEPPHLYPVEILVGVLKLGKTIHWTILEYADNGV